MTTRTKKPDPAQAALWEALRVQSVYEPAFPLDCVQPDSDLAGDPPSPALREHIAAIGVLTPVWLVDSPPADRPYQVAAGRRRIQAARLAGLPTVPALLFPAGTDAALLGLLENNLRSENPGSDVVNLAGARGRYADAEVSRLTGLAPARLKARARLLDALPPGILRALVEGRVRSSVAESIARLVDPGLRTTLEALLAERGPEGTLTQPDVDAVRRVQQAAASTALSALLPALPTEEEDTPTAPPAPTASGDLRTALWHLDAAARLLPPDHPALRLLAQVRGHLHDELTLAESA